MESRENPVFGRKIFFLHPNTRIQGVIINPLKKAEYEVYTISDYKDCKPILSENENAICFINIDEQLSVKEWFNFIYSFKNDLTLSQIIIGVISKNARPQDKEQFILKLGLPAGFINIMDSPVLIYENIIKILELNGAKGRRKYVRLDCFGLNFVKANCMQQNRLVDFVLDDISSVGFAARCSKADSAFFQKGGIYGITLHLGPKDYIVNAVIYAIKENEKDNTLVFIMAPSTAEQIKDEIRNFVFKVLQYKMNIFVSSAIKDETDYSQEIKIEKQEIEVPHEYEVFNDIDDLEPL